MAFEDELEIANRAVADSLGIPATWTPKGSGSPVDVLAVFHRNHRVFSPDSDVMVQSTVTTLWVVLSDLPREPEEDDRITIDADAALKLALSGRYFRVASHEPDGVGGTMLVLQKALPP